ncbi:MAG: IPT/TIG domain-containing protein [Deltaproteobacteria bacterium]|nr:IPT/TIG domain-containing protein [Deltaproteobacteria bacterium]
MNEHPALPVRMKGVRGEGGTKWRVVHPDIMKRVLLGIFLIVPFLSGCGGADSPAGLSTDSSVVSGVSPIVISVAPTSGKAGDAITISGIGFSINAPANIVSVGNAATQAVSWALLNPPTNGAVESITFTVPSGATAGAGGIFVTVFELTSNADVQFTVTP